MVAYAPRSSKITRCGRLAPAPEARTMTRGQRHRLHMPIDLSTLLSAMKLWPVGAKSPIFTPKPGRPSRMMSARQGTSRSTARQGAVGCFIRQPPLHVNYKSSLVHEPGRTPTSSMLARLNYMVSASRECVRAAFDNLGSPSKCEIAQAIGKHVPALCWRRRCVSRVGGRSQARTHRPPSQSRWGSFLSWPAAITVAQDCGKPASRPNEHTSGIHPRCRRSCSSKHKTPAGELSAGVRSAMLPSPAGSLRPQARSKRSRFITLVHAATKSFTNFSFESAHP